MKWHLMLVVLALLLASCATPTSTDNPMLTEGSVALPEQSTAKADNYISTNAREYLLRATVNIEVEEEDTDALSEEERNSAFLALVGKHTSRITSALRNHVNKVLASANNGETGEDASYFTFVKRQNAQSEPEYTVFGDELEFLFEMELVGSFYLMSILAPDDSGRRTFDVVVPSDYSYSEQLELTVEIEGTESSDAFPKYAEIFEDGVYDIAIHFGGDYNEERFDLDTARWVIETLVEDGWENPEVQTFEDLKIDSPPFTMSVAVEGQQIEVQVYVYHSDMVTEEDENRLGEAMETSLGTRDIVFYSGHAGSGAGFILDYQPRFEIKPSTFSELNMADKYQIYILDGCRTYRTYVDDIMDNPHKTFENLDIVTTVNTTPFSAGYQVIWEFLYWMTLTDRDGGHFPLSWKSVLRGVNKPYPSVHYGVHGIDDNPQVNPITGLELACYPCTTSGDCGGGGNFCLSYSQGPACGVACTTDTACGDGYRCARITKDPDLFYIPKQCVRRDYLCE
jgi:hypothetical protein